MRSPENIQLDNERLSALQEFMQEVAKSIEIVNAKADRHHCDYKEEVRRLCYEYAEKLGIPAGLEKAAAMYFFIYLYENPEAAHALWEELFNLSQSLNAENLDNEQIFRSFERVFQSNPGGMTHMWSLVHAIARGDIEIQQIKGSAMPVYYAQILDDTERKKRNADPKRKEIQAPLKQAVIEYISIKPTPNVPKDILEKFSKEELRLLMKIFIYLQEDANLIIESAEWRRPEVINQYFNQVEEFLIESHGKIEIQPGRAGTRKEKFAEFIKHIINGYLKNLRQYCLKMAEDKEENRFAADAMLEASFIYADYIDTKGKEPSLGKIASRWKRLVKDINNALNDNATLLSIPVFVENAPDADASEFSDGCEAYVHRKSDTFHLPRDTGEITPLPPIPVQGGSEAIRNAVKSTIIGVAVPSLPKSEAAHPPKRRSSVNSTMLWIKAVQDPPEGPVASSTAQSSVDPLAPTVAVSVIHDEHEPDKGPIQNVQPSAPQTVTSTPRSDMRQKIPFEDHIKNIVWQEIVGLKKQILDGTIDVNCQSSASLLNRLQEIFKKCVASDNLRIFFIQECCRLINELNASKGKTDPGQKLDAVTREYIYSSLYALFSGIIFQYIEIPDEVEKILGGKNGGIPDNNTVGALQFPPQIEDYPLVEGLISKDDPVMEEINRYVSLSAANLTNFAYYFNSLVRIAEGNRDAVSEFAAYYNHLREEYETMKSMIEELRKKLSPKFFKRLFGKGRRSNAEIQEYFTRLSQHADRMWNEGIEPSMRVYGKLILGKSKK